MRGRRAVAAFALPTVLALAAACTGTSAEEADDTPSSSGATGTTASATPGGRGSAAPVADPEHAVDPPGPRTGVVGIADVLVYNTSSLSPATVRRIRQLDGVTRVETLSLAQVVIENEAITVAAVDPGTYRNFTPYASAETQAVWDRVAGGELALRPALRDKLPTDKQDYLRLGSDKDATAVHIGAFAPQTPEVDAVVNSSWAPTLGMEPDNALLIATGQTSPESLRTKIERIAGNDASVQMTDIVARRGLDPDVKQTAFLVGTVADAVGTFNYTVLGGGRIAPDPAWVSSHIATQTVPILGSVTCNKLIFPQLTAALNEIVDRGLADKIHPGEYAGCYYPRFIAGTTSLSNHSFGLALDLNVPGNQRGTAGEMDRDVVAIFKQWGFAWGGDWHYTDPMHFEMNALVNPR
ncbi:M15 family metallopeptidase [Nocardioides sp. MAHUQ-72]|uniref:M15 family metallopeptidase n=1 Tax=unclassified Nocardioides TaxID=2615069 RepID=UPI00360B4B34